MRETSGLLPLRQSQSHCSFDSQDLDPAQPQLIPPGSPRMPSPLRPQDPLEAPTVPQHPTLPSESSFAARCHALHSRKTVLSGSLPRAEPRALRPHRRQAHDPVAGVGTPQLALHQLCFHIACQVPLHETRTVGTRPHGHARRDARPPQRGGKAPLVPGLPSPVYLMPCQNAHPPFRKAAMLHHDGPPRRQEHQEHPADSILPHGLPGVPSRRAQAGSPQHALLIALLLSCLAMRTPTLLRRSAG